MSYNLDLAIMEIKVGPQLRRVEALSHSKLSPLRTEIEIGIVGESPIGWNCCLLSEIDRVGTICQTYVGRTSRIQRITCVCKADCSECQQGGEDKVAHHAYTL